MYARYYMTLRDFYNIFTEDEREEFTFFNKSGMPIDIVCVYSPKKKRILYYGQLSGGVAGMSSDHTVNIETIEFKDFEKYKIREKETIARLFSLES